jgi:hypothetical protein
VAACSVCVRPRQLLRQYIAWSQFTQNNFHKHVSLEQKHIILPSRCPLSPKLFKPLSPTQQPSAFSETCPRSSPSLTLFAQLYHLLSRLWSRIPDKENIDSVINHAVDSGKIIVHSRPFTPQLSALLHLNAINQGTFSFDSVSPAQGFR